MSGNDESHLMCNDDSYQDFPALDFDNSRAEGVKMFARAANLGGPSDFSFLMGGMQNRSLSKNNSDVDTPPGCRTPDNEMAGYIRSDGPDRKRAKARTLSMPLAPRPPQRPTAFVFGQSADEDRGPKAMVPTITRNDVFSWVRDDSKEDLEVQELLRDEDKYADEMQQHLSSFRELLYKEMRDHVHESDAGLPIRYPGGYTYEYRMFDNKSYSAHYRRRVLEGGSLGPEELVIDNNEVAIDPHDGSQRPYCSANDPKADPTHRLYAYSVDFVGDGAYEMRLCTVRGSGVEAPHVAIPYTDGSVEWAPAGDCFYYVALDSELRDRSSTVKRHIIGEASDGGSDVTLWKEEDKAMNVGLGKSHCGRYLIVSPSSAETGEVRLLDLENPSSGLHRVAPREFGHKYSVDHHGGWFYIVTNKDGAVDSKLFRAPVSALPDALPNTWEMLWTPEDGTTIESHSCFQAFMALQGRQRGAPAIFVYDYAKSDAPLHTVMFPEVEAHSGRVSTPRGIAAASAAFSAWVGNNPCFESEFIRYHYTSFTVPEQTYDYHVPTRRHMLLKQNKVPFFDQTLYRTDRITSHRRGVPITLVYRTDIHSDGLAGGPFPCLLTGYGCYGVCEDPGFDPKRLALLDRGVVYAVAHVRGGGEFGKRWHEEGRYLKVKNRFLDFVDAAETLLEQRITTSDRLTSWGTSSGGNLVAGTTNLRPDLFKALLLEVPFVDVLRTMGDPSIPLTTQDWEEYGNPNERDFFYYIQDYSPYDNLRFGERYPAVLATASLNDAMVGYWEPLKYVSKLRLVKSDDNPVLLKVNFHAGHGSASDRFQTILEAAFQFAFLLDQMGLSSARSGEF